MVARTKFSNRTIAGLKHRDVRYEVVEPGRTGLSIRVEARPSTRKSWYYLYRGKKDGRSVARRMKLGEYPGTGLQEARRLLNDATGVKLRGGDPARVVAEAAKRAQQEAREAETVATVSERYLKEEVRGKLAGASATENMFDRDILPVIGEMKIKQRRRRGVWNMILANFQWQWRRTVGRALESD